MNFLDIILYGALFLILPLTYLIYKFQDFYQKIICMNMITNIGAIAIITLGSYSFNTGYIDIAFVYLLLGYIVCIFINKII